MANNIRDFNGISFFYELSSTGANGLKEIYKEYIQETNKLGIKPMEQNGKEILSIFLNRVLTDDLILQDVNGLLPERDNEDDSEKVVTELTPYLGGRRISLKTLNEEESE